MATQESISSDKDITPRITEKDVAQLVSELFGLTCVSMKVLNSYDDQNFQLKVAPTTNNNYITEVKSGYIFKIMSTEYTEHNLNHLDGELRVLEHLLERGIVCPRHVKDKQGRLYSIQALVTGKCPEPRKHAVRLVEYIEGDILCNGEITPELMHDAGQSLAQLHTALEGFTEPRLTKTGYIWDIFNFLDIEPYIKYVESEENRTLAHQVVSKWREIQPVFNKLEHAVIHQDFNEQNIIISHKEDGNQYIKAVIDFNDSGIAPRACDVGIFLMYTMIVTADNDPLKFVKDSLKGYLSKRSLTESELLIVYYSIAARLVTSCAQGEFMYSKYKNPYHLTTPKPGWKSLKLLWAESPEELIHDWIR